MFQRYATPNGAKETSEEEQSEAREPEPVRRASGTPVGRVAGIDS
jgi:hypothetical protein